MADERDIRDTTAEDAVLDDGQGDQEVEVLEYLDDDGHALDPADDAPEGPAGDDSDEVAALRREIADLRDRSMRTLADFDNFRKRTERERRDAQRFAALGVLRDLLEVTDNLARALAAGGSADDLKTGVEMILRQLEELLRRHGVEAIAARGERFDPAVHEAVSRLEDPDVATATVVDELQRGYRLHERLLRPARVVVAVPPEEE